MCHPSPQSYLYTHSVYYRVYDWKMRYLARLTLIIKLGKQHRKDIPRVDIQGIHTLQVRSARLSKPSTSKVICLHGNLLFERIYGYQQLLPPKKGLQFWINSSSSGRCFTRHSSWSHQMVSCDQNSCWRFRQLEAWSSLGFGFCISVHRHAYIHRKQHLK